MKVNNPLLWLGMITLATAPVALTDDPPPVPVGAAAVDIAPWYPVRLMGYGSRKTESEGVASRLKAKALAVGADAEGPAVLVVVDNCGMPAQVTEEVAAG